MTMRLFPLFLLLALSLAHAEVKRLPYVCDNGSRLDISFSAAADGRPQATLHFADGEVILPGVPAASGALYRSGDIRLHTKGDDAVFEDGKSNMRRCKQGSMAPPAAADVPATPSGFFAVTGSVSYPAGIALPPDAMLIIRVQDTARADAPARLLAEQQIALAGQQVPVSFRILVDRDMIGQKTSATVSARIERGGKLLFISDTVHPALIDRQPQHVDMRLKQVGTGRPR